MGSSARRKRSSSWASAWHLELPVGLTASDGSWCSVPWCTGREWSTDPSGLPGLPGTPMASNMAFLIIQRYPKFIQNSSKIHPNYQIPDFAWPFNANADAAPPRFPAWRTEGWGQVLMSTLSVFMWAFLESCGIPKSPWVSILTWSNFGWFRGTQHSRKPPCGCLTLGKLL